MAQLPHTVPAIPLESDYSIWHFEKTVRQQVKPSIGAITQKKKFTVELGDANVFANEWHSSLTQCLPYHQNVIIPCGDILTVLLCACSPRTDNFKAKIAQKFLMLTGYHSQTCVRQEQDVQHLNLWMFSFVRLELTRFSQAAAGRNPWLDSSKYPKKYPKCYVRQQANALSNFAECDSCRVNHH